MSKFKSLLKAIYQVFYVDSKNRYIITQELIDEIATGEVKKDL